MAEEVDDVKAERIWDYAFKALVPLSLVLGSAIVAHEVRIARLEESRFSESDARALEMRMIERPQPEWLKTMLGEIRAELKRVNERLGELERRP